MSELSQWRYDHTTATYLLLLSKKQRGKPVRLRPAPTVCEDSCSPLHQGIQVRLGTTTPTMLFSLSGSLDVQLFWLVLYTYTLNLAHLLFPSTECCCGSFCLVVFFLFSLSLSDEGSPSF